MASPLEQIKDRLDIVEFIRSYISLLPAGRNFKALCPFHNEKTPSFIISPERQLWHCFGACSEGGDVVKFLMKYENLEFYEALKILAEKAGVELRKFSPGEYKQFGILYEINEAAKNFFRQNLEGAELDEVQKYLLSRGLKKETFEEFELGLAPAKRDSLALYLIKKGYDQKDIERTGLVYQNDSGSFIDRFRGRIIFPIYNHFGKAIGFSGRILPQFETPEIGKYINTPETLIFNKSKILYGFHKTKEFIRQQKSAVLVEGQMDFLLSYQDGIKNVIAVSGTALTQEHLKTLRRQADELIFCFDSDEAGFKAAERSIDLANLHDFNVKILVLKDYKDPAEAVLKQPGMMTKLLGEAKHAMEFYFGRYLSSTDSPRANADLRGIRIVLAKIKNLFSPIEKNHWLKQLSLKIGVKEEVLADEMNKIRNEKPERKNEEIKINAVRSLSRRERIAERLACLLINKQDFPILRSNKDYFTYLPQDYLMIIESLENLREQKKIENGPLNDKLNFILLRSSLEPAVVDEEETEEEFAELCRQLKAEYFKEKREELVQLIKKTEIEGREEETAFKLKEFDEISKLTHNS